MLTSQQRCCLYERDRRGGCAVVHRLEVRTQSLKSELRVAVGVVERIEEAFSAVLFADALFCGLAREQNLARRNP